MTSTHRLQFIFVLLKAINAKIVDNDTTEESALNGCAWFGTAPFCLGGCPSGYDHIRESDGRCKDLSSCPPDPSFGEPCLALFGINLTKKYCCRSDPTDCSWSGRWMGSQDAFNFYCRYDGTIGRCGRLDCSVNSPYFKSRNTSLIGGDDCDELFMWNLHGKATCGYIAWFWDERFANSWYKAH